MNVTTGSDFRLTYTKAIDVEIDQSGSGLSCG